MDPFEKAPAIRIIFDRPTDDERLDCVAVAFNKYWCDIWKKAELHGEKYGDTVVGWEDLDLRLDKDDAKRLVAALQEWLAL